MDPGRLTQITARLARHRLSRRAALGTGGAGLAAALFGPVGAARVSRAAQEATPAVASEPGANLPPNVPAWMKEPGAPSSELSERAPQEQGVVRVAPAPDVSFSPLAAIPGTLTPNALF
jgi:sulfane dehydrogenase subunit SoxC